MSHLNRDPLEDRYDMELLFANQPMTSDANKTSNEKKTASQIFLFDMNKKAVTGKGIFLSSRLFWKVVLLLCLISLVGYGILIYFSIMNNIGVGQLKRQLAPVGERETIVTANYYRGQHKKAFQGNTSIVTENIEEMNYFNVSCESMTGPSKLVIFSAIYVPKWDTPTCQNDVTHLISRECSSSNSCVLHVVNDIFPKSSCHGNIKELIITYACTTDQYLFGPIFTNADSPSKDIPYKGSFVTSGITSIEACGKKCLEVSGCAGIVYAPRSDLCWFKESMTQRHHVDNRESMMVFNFQQPSSLVDDTKPSTDDDYAQEIL